MTWDSIINSVKSIYSGAVSYIDKLKGAWEQGQVLYEDILGVATWIRDNKDEILKVDIKEIINSIINNGAENEYKAVVKSMTFAELLEFQRMSLEELKAQNNAKYSQLYVIRTIASLPERLWPIIKMVF